MTTTINPLNLETSSFKIKLVEQISLDSNSNSSSLFGNIDDFKKLDNRLIIFDQTKTRALLFFDNKGGLLSRTHIGKGPGELIHPTSFSTYKNKVFVPDSRFVIEFDLNGNYISKTPIPEGLFIDRIEFLSDELGFVAGSSIPPDRMDENTIFLFHSLSSNLKKYHAPFIQSEIGLIGLGGRNNLSLYDGNAIFVGRPSDIIYESDGFTIKEKYYIDFKKKKYTSSDIKKGMQHLIEQIRSEMRMGMLDNVMESDDFLVFSYLIKGAVFLDETFIIYSKKNRKNCKGADLFSNYGYPKMRILELNKDVIICSLLPSDFDEKVISALIESGKLPEKTTSESNPILFFFRLKI